MRRKPVDFKKLRDLIRVETVLKMFGWSHTFKRGECCRGPCPFHGSKRSRSVSLKVIPRVCFCHKCHFTGDGVAVYARLKGVDVLTAAHEVCQILAIQPPTL